MRRNQLYLLLGVACLAGYAWVYFEQTYASTHPGVSSVCLVKHVTNIPCPSCGSTRAVLNIIEGNWGDALYLNPLGYLIAAILLLLPLWILFDWVARKNSLYFFYKRTEAFLTTPRYAIPLVTLLAANWIWNIIKGL